MFESKNIIIMISICLIISHIVQLIYQYKSPKSEDETKLATSSYISIPLFITVITFIIQLALLWVAIKLDCLKSE
jgi:hypothetical protein